MSSIEVAPGVELYVERDGAGDPVILLQGGGMTHAVWDHQIPALSREFATITLDYRGTGRSGRVPGAYSVDAFAHDVRDLMSTLGIEQASVVGYALGAHVALRLAAISPLSVGRLVLVAGAPWFVRPDGGGGLPPELWARMKSSSATDRGQADLDLIDHELFHRPPSEGMRLWCAQMAFTWPLPVFEQLASTLAHVDHTDVLASIEAPTLVIHGRHDIKTPLEGGLFLAEHIPGARLVTLDDSGHCPPLEEVETFNEILLGFLRAPRGSSEPADPATPARPAPQRRAERT